MLIDGDETETYHCPHCKGFIKLHQQFYHNGGESHWITHIDESEVEKELIDKDLPIQPKKE